MTAEGRPIRALFSLIQLPQPATLALRDQRRGHDVA